ncbi:MAG: DUF1559 domain-containing protein [Gemmataceae bacterium]|nr:DUF1559 domain-containing protein [Gemmataceae bacterium]
MSPRHGITVLEVLVVLVLCILVGGLGIVMIARHRENAQREMCKNNLRVLGGAVHAYHGKPEDPNARQYFPPSRIADGYATWAVLIAPHMLSEHPLLKWDVQQSYFAQPTKVREARVIFHFCPTRTRLDTLSSVGDLDAKGVHFPGGLGDYASVAGDGAGDNGALVDARLIHINEDRTFAWQSLTSLASLKRGQSNTLLLGEKHVPVDRMGDAAVGDGTLYSGQNLASFSRNAGPGFALAPSIDAPFNNNFGSWHSTVNFLMADGSVRSLAPSVNEALLGQLARRGE